MAKFSDRDAARRLRDRLAREIAGYVLQGDPSSATDLSEEPAWDWLNGVADEEPGRESK